MSGIGSTVAQGMAFGTGSAIAHQAVGSVARGLSGGDSGSAPEYAQGGPTPTGTSADMQPQLTGPCANDKQMFFECLQVNKGDQQSCTYLYDILKTCQSQTPAMEQNNTQFY